MAHPPSGPSGGPQALPQGDLNSQGKLDGSGRFVAPSGTRTVKPVDAEPKSGNGNTGAPAVSPANKQRTISATESDGGDEGVEDVKPFQALFDSLDDSEFASQASDDSAASSGSGRSEVENDPEDLIPDTNKDFPASVDTETAGTASHRMADATESGDEGYKEGVASDQAMLPGRGDVKTGLQAPDHSAISPGILNAPENVVSPPNTSFPVPVDSKADEDTITIGNTGAKSDATIDGDETITVEGGDKVNKGKFFTALKALANGFMGLFKNKIAVGLAVFFALTFILGLLASPVGAPLVFVLMVGLSAAITCGLTGLLMADLAPNIGQQQEPDNSQNPNQQNNNQSDKSSSEIDKTKSDSDSSQPGAASTDANDTNGSIAMTSNEKKASAPVARGGGNSPDIDSTAAVAATEAAESRLEKEFSPEVFDTWFNENFLRLKNEPQFLEFFKSLRGKDDHTALDMDGKLDSLLTDLHRKGNDLSLLAHSPLTEKESSGPRQWDRLYDFQGMFDEALTLLDPTPEHCRTMFIQLMRALPKEAFPWVSSNLYSPLLSVGDQRKSLEGLTGKEIARIEVSDMLRLALRRLDSYGKEAESQKESEGQEKRSQVQSVQRKRAADSHNGESQDGEPPEKVRIIEKTSSIEAKPVETDERRKEVLKRLERNLVIQDVDWNIPDVANYGVKNNIFLINVRNGVFNWDEGQKVPGEDSVGKKPDLTEKNFQKLVVIELGKAVFAVGKRRMDADQAERSRNGENDRDPSVLIDLASPANRKEFLESIYREPAILRVFKGITATEEEQNIAKDYFRLYIK